MSDELFPFTSRFVDLDGNRAHYVDEGSSPVLLMLHGNPAWSFLYRHLITGLRPSFRCIALDYPGFGLSTARDGYPFRPADHARVVEVLTDALGLGQITFVVNDWAARSASGWPDGGQNASPAWSSPIPSRGPSPVTGISRSSPT